MAITNSEITTEITLVDEKIKTLFVEFNKQLKALEQPFINVNSMLALLLHNPNMHPLTNLPNPITLDQLNHNYIHFIQKTNLPIIPLELVKKRSNPDDNEALAKAINIHIEAIAYGFRDIYLTETTKEIKNRLSRFVEEMSRVRNITKQKVIELLTEVELDATTGVSQPLTLRKLYESYQVYVQDYRNLPATLIDCNLSAIELECAMPEITAHLEAIKSNQPVAKQAIYPALLENIAGTLLYPIGQIYLRIEQMYVDENSIANTISLSITALAAWQGYILGALLATSFFINPIIGAICISLLATSATLAATKWGEKIVCQTLNSDSAINSDPRFSLTNHESNLLYQKGFDTDVVREAIRECAIEFRSQPNNALAFWKPSQQAATVNKLRALKAGLKEAKISINGKFFNLMQSNDMSCFPPPVKRDCADDNAITTQPLSTSLTF